MQFYYCTFNQVTLNVGFMKPRKGFTPIAAEEELVIDTEGRVFELLGRGDHRMSQEISFVSKYKSV